MNAVVAVVVMITITYQNQFDAQLGSTEVSGFCRAILKRLIPKCLSVTAMRLTNINNNRNNQMF